MVYSLRFRVLDLEFRVESLGFTVQGLGFVRFCFARWCAEALLELQEAQSGVGEDCHACTYTHTHTHTPPVSK